MVPNQRLPHRGQLLEDFVVEIGKADLAARAKNAVLDDEPFELAFPCIRQGVPGPARIFFTISKRRGDRPRSDAAGTGRHCGRAGMRAITKYAPRVYLPAIA